MSASDDADFEKFVREETGGRPVDRDELWQLREEFDERRRDGEEDEEE